MTRRSVYIKSYGCQMNVYDAGRMTDALAPAGYAPVDLPDHADLVILNTCHIREKAAEKVFSDLGRLRPLKQARLADGARMTVVVAGCVAQAEGAELMARAPIVDVVVGPQTYHRLPELVARAEHGGGRQLDTEFPTVSKFDSLPDPVARGPAAFLSIQEGCDKFCTFCVVPYTRGAEYSRPVADVVAEARRLVSDGVREITLLGQNVNAYHGLDASGREVGLGRLARHLAEIDGLTRLRYTTSHPRDVDAELIAAHCDVPQLVPFLHLPVQSGSDRILKAMNRGHTVDAYRRHIDAFLAVRPDMQFSSDFIVGFPGETEADLEATLTLARDIGFIQAYSFKYSPRPGTPAADQEDQIAESVKAERLARLQAILSDNQQRFNARCVGMEMEILMDRPGKYPGQLVGRSVFMQPVHMMAPQTALGQICRVRVTDALPNSLAAESIGSFEPSAEANRPGYSPAA